MTEHDERSDLDRKLGRWVDAALITDQQADTIRNFESAVGVPIERRTPLIAEALGYLGAALALAAGFVVLGRDWMDWTAATRTSILGVATVLLLAGGLAVHGKVDPAIARLGSVLWLLSVAAGMWFLGEVFAEVLELDEDVVPLAMGAGTAIYGGVLYAARRRALQQLGFAVGCAVTVWPAGFLASPAEPYLTHSLRWVGPAVWLLGVAWLLLTRRGVFRPAQAGYAIGGLLALLGPFFRDGDFTGVDIALGVLTAVGLLAMSVRLRETVLLGMGAVGLFAHLIAAIGEYFGDTAGMPVVLFAAGVLLIAIALVTARLKRFTEVKPTA